MNDRVVTFPIHERDLARQNGADGGRPLIAAHDHEGQKVWVPVDPLRRDSHYPEFMDDLNWFVVRVSGERRAPAQPSHERCARAEISAMSLPVLLPVGVRQVRKRSVCGRPMRGHEHVAYPLLPGYLLVGFSDGDLRHWPQWHERLCACRHVAGVLGIREGSSERPVRLQREGFSRLRMGLNAGVYDESIRDAVSVGGMMVGDLVEILEGPFEYFRGLVKAFRTQAEGRKRVVSKAFVQLEVLGSQRDVELPVDNLRIVD